MPSTFISRWWHPYFLTLMEWLGIRIFKRYWPVEGSFWNHHHINPSQNSDLKIIIRSSWEKVQFHVGGNLAEIIVLSLLTLTGYLTLDQIIRYLPATTSYHLLAILVNSYNIIRAHHRIQKNDQLPAKVQPIEPVKPIEPISINQVQHEFVSGYQVRYRYHELSPILATKAQAEHYRKFVYQEWGQNPFQYEEKIFLGQDKDLYSSYQKTLNA